MKQTKEKSKKLRKGRAVALAVAAVLCVVGAAGLVTLDKVFTLLCGLAVIMLILDVARFPFTIND